MDRVVSEAMPQEKLQVVREECQRGHHVIVVGDGINDALALAAGNVGIAMGARGSDIAIQSADIALMTNDLKKIPLAIRLSRKTQRLITQNIVVAVSDLRRDADSWIARSILGDLWRHSAQRGNSDCAGKQCSTV